MPLIDYWRLGTEFASVMIYALINNQGFSNGPR